jgi:putative restriction endonuclease
MQPFRNVRHRFTTTEYSQLLQSGVLAPDVHVELIRGEIMDIAPRNSGHASAMAVLHERLVAVVQPQGHVRSGMPLVLDERSQPAPDLAVVSARADHYRGAHPTGHDALLLIEVADQALLYDRTIKTSLYAAACVPAVWIANLPAGELHCLSEPRVDGYRQRVVLRREDRAALPAPFDAGIELAGIL